MSAVALDLSSVNQVDYTDMRNNIQSGDLLAWSTDNASLSSKILTTLVRFFTLSEFSHVGIAYREDGRLYVLEATIPKIQLRLLSERKGFYYVPMRVAWESSYEPFLKHYIGKKYSILDCIRGYLGKTDISDDRWQCAELCNDFYKHIGIDLQDNYTPAKLVKAAMSRVRSSILYIS